MDAGGDQFGFLGLAEIEAAGQLAHDKDIDAVTLAFFAQRAGMGKFLRELDGAEIGEEAELLAETEQRRAFGAFFPLGMVGKSRSGRPTLPKRMQSDSLQSLSVASGGALSAASMPAQPHGTLR